MEGYRRRQSDCMPRFDQSFTGHCEQNMQDTLQLKQRYLDAKAKRVPKTKAEKKHQDSSIQSSVHVQQKFLKRSADELDPGGAPNESFEPPVKLQCSNEGLTKFSVEIVQQLEFTTSAASSQPQQISTNVTVKTHANASVKSDVSSPKANPDHQKTTSSSNIGLDVGTLVECVKQEPDNDFADLDQCAAALEKDAAANGGAGFGGFPDLIGDDTNDEIISSATFKDLISDISNYHDYELMKDFDFEDKLDIKVEDIKNIPTSQESKTTTSSPLLQQNNPRMPSYPSMDFTKTELSPAAQTLKQMAEQHQHKNQMGLSFTAARSPYGEFQFQGSDYGSPNSIHKNSPTFPQPDMIKQEMIFQGNEYDMKRKNPGIYKQQYSPYSSPSASSHGSPGYLPRSSTGPTNNSGAFGGGTPPRPPSGPGGGNNQNSGTTNVQINQAQQLNISQQNHGHTIQVSAGQHVHLTGDIKGNVSIATQQGMHFTQQSSQSNSNQNQQSTNANQPSPMSNPQHQNSPMSNGVPNQSPMGHSAGNQMSGGNMQMSGGQMGQNMQGPGGMSSSGNMAGNDNMSNNMTGPGNMGMPSSNMGPGNGGNGLGGMNSNMGGSGGLPGPMGGMQHHPMHNVGGMGGHNDTYSMSQTQTINFTQQTLRRAGAQGVPNPMGPNGPMGPSPSGPNVGNQPGPGPGMGPRLMTAQSLEQQKLLHQQQMLRAQQQQAAMQQHMVRPPPPDYKTSAGMMQGMQPRYATPAPPPNMRRMPMQPMPPSGPMMRSNMYMMQQPQQQVPPQQMPQRAALYARQQGPIAGMESMQHNTEWRHLLMSQQQNSSFTSMRPQFQQGFGMNTNNMQQMSALQHQQQLRNQQAMVSGGGVVGSQAGMGPGMSQAQVIGQANNPMAQMNNMNQAMLHMQQQQQQHSMMQQNSHMAMSNLHLQQSQSISISNQSLQQSQQQQNLSLGGQMNSIVPSANSAQNSQNALASAFNPQADFNFEFLDNLAAADGTTFSDQELLSSFDSDPGFNLDF
ncbi:neurogenic protein mastermind-like [Diabrotica virgifera virgifera]|uniref:Neurogenic mastermind-like N-terminal domain-containing protein n=1 Tax=Diabrotica virgifera virgifera TaxID=50390 RepID=A0ABM5KZW8_DIAVI|nr:neurogenic protein mastermind-like [Diabrotica virgifera virgifera]